MSTVCVTLSIRNDLSARDASVAMPRLPLPGLRITGTVGMEHLEMELRLVSVGLKGPGHASPSHNPLFPQFLTLAKTGSSACAFYHVALPLQQLATPVTRCLLDSSAGPVQG